MILILLRLFRRWRDRRAAGASASGAVGGAPALAGHSSVGGPDVAAITTRYADASAGPSPAARGKLALLAHETRFALLASARNPRARFFTFLFPIILLVVFIGVFGHSGHTIVEGHVVKLSVFFTGGILALSVITSSYAGLLMTVITARENGVFKRRRATPVPPAVLIAGNVIATIAIAVAMTAILLLIARAGYSISIPFAALVSTFITVVVGTIAFACVGYAVAGMISSIDAAQPIAQATMLPLYFISGVWIPTDNLSHGLRDVASVFPVEHLASSFHKATVATSFSTAFSATDLLALAAWAIAAGTFAAMRFSWLPKSVAA